MEWNLELDRLAEIIDGFMKGREKSKCWEKHLIYNPRFSTLQCVWRDFADNATFGRSSHIIDIEFRYVKNVLLSVSITGIPGWKPNKRDRDYIVKTYLTPLFVELKPFIGLPMYELVTRHQVDESTQVDNIELEWMDDNAAFYTNAFTFIQISRTVLNRFRFKE